MNSGRMDGLDPQEEDEEDYNDGVVLVDPTDIEMCSDDEDTELTIDCEFDDIQEAPNLVIKIYSFLYCREPLKTKSRKNFC